MIIIAHPERTIPERKVFDQNTNTFIILPERHLKPMNLHLEHSLRSMRNWEAEYEKSFSDEIDKMSTEDLIGYIRCMTINTQRDDSVYDQLSVNDLITVSRYISRASSAWKIVQDKKRPERRRRKQPNTVESIYFTMIQLGIPIEPCEKWHFGSLMALIDYFDKKGNGGGGGKPKTLKEMQESWFRLNEANRKKYHSRG